MKVSKGLVLINILIVLLIILTSCQLKEVPDIQKTNETVQDFSKLFELKLFSDKQVYKATDKIMIWATLKYIGDKSQITIWHGDPSILFYISDGKEFNTGGTVNTILMSTTLEKDKLYRFDYLKSGGYSNDEPNAEFWKKFYAEKDLVLPVGEYDVKVCGGFSLSAKDTQNGSLSEQIHIKVEK